MAFTLRLHRDSAAPARPLPGAAFGLPDIAALVGVAALATAARAPGLMTVPRFTDEQLDVLYTLPLYRLQALPIVGFDPYNGPLLSYLLAAALWLLGPQPYVPRLVSLVLGVGAVAATYWLGRRLGGRAAGLIGAALLAFSTIHVVINSHIAWSNATTPFFSTVAFLAILPAVTRGSGPRLALGALAFALALQTHPSVLFFLPGVGLAVLLRRPGLIRSRWLLLAGVLFVLGYGNMIAFNLALKQSDPYWEHARLVVPGWSRTDDDAIGRLSHEERMNAEGGSGLTAYPTNLALMAFNLPRVAAGLVEPRPVPADFLREPGYWAYAALLLAGLAWPLRRGNPLLLFGALSFLALIPLFNAKYEPIFNGRYVMPVLPLAFAGFGVLVADLWFSVATRPARLAIGLATAVLVLYPLVPLVRYHQRHWSDGQVNHELVQTAAAVASAGRAGEPLLLDEALGRRGLVADGDLLMNLQVFLAFRDVAFRVGAVSPGKLDGELGGARDAIVIVAQPYDRGLDARYRFTPIEEQTARRWAAYRIERRG